MRVEATVDASRRTKKSPNFHRPVESTSQEVTWGVGRNDVVFADEELGR